VSAARNAPFRFWPMRQTFKPLIMPSGGIAYPPRRWRPIAYSGPSLRSGFLTSAAESGASVFTITEVRTRSTAHLAFYPRSLALRRSRLAEPASTRQPDHELHAALRPAFIHPGRLLSAAPE
jgi:hypothetical protein